MDLKDMMQKAQELQQKMQAVQQEVADLEVTGEAGAGLVRVTMNGRYEVRAVELDDSLMREDKSVIEDLLAAACTDCARKVGEAQNQKMSEAAQGFGLPLGPFGKMSF